MSYYLEIDKHEGGVISRQLICELNCFLVSKGKQMKTHTHNLYYLAAFCN